MSGYELMTHDDVIALSVLVLLELVVLICCAFILLLYYYYSLHYNVIIVHLSWPGPKGASPSVIKCNLYIV